MLPTFLAFRESLTAMKIYLLCKGGEKKKIFLQKKFFSKLRQSHPFKKKKKKKVSLCGKRMILSDAAFNKLTNAFFFKEQKRKHVNDLCVCSYRLPTALRPQPSEMIHCWEKEEVCLQSECHKCTHFMSVRCQDGEREKEQAS